MRQPSRFRVLTSIDDETRSHGAAADEQRLSVMDATPTTATYRAFLLGDPRVERYFSEYHPDFFDPALWQESKARLIAGVVPDCFPYDPSMRFCVRYPENFAQDTLRGTPGFTK